MALEQAWKWTQPSSLPWIFWAWLAILIAGWMKPLWERWQRRRRSQWPVAQARIESVEAADRKMLGMTLGKNQKDSIVARIAYSYATGGGSHGGHYERSFASREDALEFLRDLQGKTLVVHYDPAKVEASVADEASLQTLLDSRAPAPEGDATFRKDEVPDWMKPLLWPFVVLSAIGLVLSLWVHLGSLTGHRVESDFLFMGLHAGIFVVWFPAVLVASRRSKGKGDWNAMLRGAPDGLKYMAYAFFAYAMVNFLYFMSQAPEKQHGPNPPAPVWRGFSGHWMVFYSLALAILYAAAVSPSGGDAQRPGASDNS